MQQSNRNDQKGVKISVVIPAYNYAHILRRAAESVLLQLGGSAELIIIDDGSTDNTPAVIEALERDFSDCFRAVRQDNAGLAAVRNKGLDIAQGQYLIFLDADDEMLPGALAALNEHIDLRPDTQLVIGGHVSRYPDGREDEHLPDPLPPDAYTRVRNYLIERTLGVSNGACAMRKDIFSHGRYPERFRSAEDIPVFAQVFAHGVCTNLDHLLTRIYKHDDSMRHDLKAGLKVGDQLVGEIFDGGRLPAEMNEMRKLFAAQRYLSLFRTALAAGEDEKAKELYKQALSADWRAIFRTSYTRKALRLWVGMSG
ncbi:glycosyltransferase family 2 protein [Pseudomonas sp. FME51]|uniref:glycosyltransferase family 2 protein n=1 Tax=Pseudomonas sp. FME51 TaxID=2742609 RepID=UPI0018676008|nr:glycosyltransferase family 2 protein [Pseudomonas sp. FME51]